jgi:aminoglycoside 3-N-acetyltransferase
MDYNNVEQLFIKLFNYWINEIKATILIPAFTPSFTKTNFYDINSKSEVGILADIIKNNFKDSIRTEDPLYSFIIIGPLKNIFLNCKSKTSFGENSIFEMLEKYNSKILTINTDHLTLIHRYEELNNVPYRFFKEFNGIFKNNDFIKDISTLFYCRYQDERLKENISGQDLFNKMDTLVNKYNISDSSYVYILYCNDLKIFLNKNLSIDKFYLVKK